MSRNPLDNNRLSSILGASQALAKDKERLLTLPVEQIHPGQGQPRRAFDEERLHSLSESIRQRGVLQPLIVRQAPHGYELIAGERRWRAAQLAGFTEVPVIVKSMSDQEASVVALIENLQREDLNTIDELDGKLKLVASALDIPLEQAAGRLNELRRNPVPEDIAALEAVFTSLGERWESFAKNKLRILNYPPELVKALREGMALTLVTLIARAPEEHHSRLLELALAGMSRRVIRTEIEALLHRPRSPLTRQVSKALSNQKWMNGLSASEAEELQTWLTQMPQSLKTLVEEQNNESET